MKKIITSALIAGLFLGTVVPVFAEQELEDTPTTGKISITSNVETTYKITIPADAEIKSDQIGEDKPLGVVKMTDLTTVGYVNVKTDVKDLTLDGKGDAETFEKMEIELGSDQDDFNLKPDEDENTKEITVSTVKDDTKSIVSGDYTGAIDFTFTYDNGVVEAEE